MEAALASSSLLCSNLPLLRAEKASILSWSTVATCWGAAAGAGLAAQARRAGGASVTAVAASAITPIFVHRHSDLVMRITLAARRGLFPVHSQGTPNNKHLPQIGQTDR